MSGKRQWLTVLGFVLFATWLLFFTEPRHTDPFTADAGFAGQSFAPASAPSGDKPQSKLWFHDGRWWAAMLDVRSGQIRIHELDPESQRWQAHNAVIDTRQVSHSDVLTTGDTLHVISMGPDPTDVNHGARFSRFSYDASAQKYTRQAGFPRSVTVHGAETIVLTQDSNEKMWVTYTRDGQVLVSNSDDGNSWSTPAPIPVDLAQNVSSDDIASIVAFTDRGRNAVGVLFSNQTVGAFVFAVHLDADPDNKWQSRTVIQGTKIADDHISLKSFTDGRDSQVFAAVKTSLSEPTDPLLLLLHRSSDGTWNTSTIGTVADKQTRPTLAIDSEHRRVHVFVSAPCCSGGFVFRKSTSLDSPAFQPGQGEVFIAVHKNSRLNNPTTAKHPVNSETGLVVLASDVQDLSYAHGILGLDSGSTDLDTFITQGPARLVSSSDASFTFAATSANATFECRVVGETAAGQFAPCESPATYNSLPRGALRFEVRALDPEHPSVIDASPAVRKWHFIDTIFADNFDQGLGSDWQLESRGTASVTIEAEPPRGQVATFSSDGTSRTFVTAGLAVNPKRALTIDASVRVNTEGDSAGHVRLYTFLDRAGSQLGYLYRQNKSGRLWFRVGDTRIRSTGTTELGGWNDVELALVASPSGLANIELAIDGEKHLAEEVSSLDLSQIASIELGYRTTGQRYSISLDRLQVGR